MSRPRAQLRSVHHLLVLAAVIACSGLAQAGAPEPAPVPLGLAAVPVPADNPQTPAKVALGKKLFEDQRFSSTGKVSCATCHDAAKGFADGLKTSKGINDLTGTRNAPTVLNAAYFATQFWDGRSPSLEDQSQHPFVNPIEMGLADHKPILAIVQKDKAYKKAFQEVFGVKPVDITMDHVKKAIASFERTVIAGDSPWDRWYFGGQKDAISASAQRGFQLFLQDGRCVSCHVIEQDRALFTDNQFHNIGVGINRIQADVGVLAPEFLKAKAAGTDVDKRVLSDPRASELGRFAITESLDHLGAFKTSTLRNVALTAPFMHDGSLATLKDVVVHYNNGGVTKQGDPVNDFLGGGIRPLNLTEPQIDDLVAFLESLTSPSAVPAPATPTKAAAGAAPTTGPVVARRAP